MKSRPRLPVAVLLNEKVCREDNNTGSS